MALLLSDVIPFSQPPPLSHECSLEVNTLTQTTLKLLKICPHLNHNFIFIPFRGVLLCKPTMCNGMLYTCILSMCNASSLTSYTNTHTPSYTTLSMCPLQTFLLEKFRVAQRPNGEGNFNIFYQLFAGADEQLRQDLMLYVTSEIDESNLYFEPVEDVSNYSEYCCCSLFHCTYLRVG